MKLVKEHINEKFTKDSDPIRDMGIGIFRKFEKELEKVTGKKSVFAYKPAKNPAPHGYKKDGVPKKKPGRKA